MVLLLSSLLSRLAWSGILTCLLVVLVPCPLSAVSNKNAAEISPLKRKHNPTTSELQYSSGRIFDQAVLTYQKPCHTYLHDHATLWGTVHGVLNAAQKYFLKLWNQDTMVIFFLSEVVIVLKVRGMCGNVFVLWQLADLVKHPFLISILTLQIHF